METEKNNFSQLEEEMVNTQSGKGKNLVIIFSIFMRPIWQYVQIIVQSVYSDN